MLLPLFSYPTTAVWVDDDPSFVATIPHLLESRYFKTFNEQITASSSSALRELSAQICRYNEVSVIVVDYDMPHMNGIDMCRLLKEKPVKKYF